MQHDDQHAGRSYWRGCCRPFYPVTVEFLCNPVTTQPQPSHTCTSQHLHPACCPVASASASCMLSSGLSICILHAVQWPQHLHPACCPQWPQHLHPACCPVASASLHPACCPVASASASCMLSSGLSICILHAVQWPQHLHPACCPMASASADAAGQVAVRARWPGVTAVATQPAGADAGRPAVAVWCLQRCCWAHT